MPRAGLPALLLLFASSIASATPTFKLQTASFTDVNGNGLLDCGEAVRLQAVVFDGPVPEGETRSGRITVPADFPANFRYDGWSQDFVLSANCQTHDLGAINKADFTYDCTTGAAPNNNGYVLTVNIDGIYVGPSNFLVFTGTDQITAPASEVATLTATYSESRVKSCAQPDLQLQKTDGGITSAPGRTVAYTLSTVNRGNSAASGTVLTETVPANTTFNAGASSAGWSCSSPAAGSNCTLSLGNVVVGGSASRVFAVDVGTNLPAGTNLITNTASVASLTDDANLADNTATDTTPLSPGTPDLVMGKTTSSTGALPGSLMTWTLGATNIGNAPALNVALSETVPAGTSFDAANSSGGWTCSGATCTLTIGTLNAGSSATRTFSARVKNPASSSLSSIANTACVSTTTAGDPSANNCATTSTPVGGAPLLQINKSVLSGTGTPGSVVSWKVTVTNTGDRDASNVVLSETIPPNTTFASAQSSPSWSCASPGAGSSCTATVATLTGAGGAVTLTFSTRIDSPLPAGVTSISNTVCAKAAGSPDACTTATTPTDGSPHLSLVKRVASGTGAPGSVLIYALDVQNTGNQAASNVVLQETVPDNTTFEASQSPGWTCASVEAGSSCSRTIPSIAGGGATVTAPFAVRVDNPLAASVDSILNTACITGGPVGAFRSLARGTKAAGDTCGSVTITPQAAPVLSVTKSLTSGAAAAGATVIYTVTVSNTGNQNASGVTLVDTIPAGATYAPPPASPDSWICSPAAAPSTCATTIASLNAGQTASRRIAFLLGNPLPTAQTVLTNRACASDGTRTACASTSNPITSWGSPALTLRKTYRGGPLQPGLLLPFHLEVTNSGTANANAVRLQETVPAGAAFSASDSDPGWTCTGSSCQLTLDTVAPGATRGVTFALRASNPLPAGVQQISNAACLLDSQGTALSCDQTSTPLPVQVTATLTDSLAEDADHNGVLGRGETLLYTLVVRNDTRLAAEGLRVAASLDRHLSLVVGSVVTTAGTIANGNSLGDAAPLVVLPSLAPGASFTVTFVVQAGDLNGLKEVASQGTVTGSNIEDVRSDDPDTPEPLDPTRTPLGGIAPAPIPTLGELGLALLACALGFAALRALRHRRV